MQSEKERVGVTDDADEDRVGAALAMSKTYAFGIVSKE